MIKKRAVFLDRDGVINRYPGDFQYVTSPAGLILLKGAAQAIKRLNYAGFAVFVVSNQAGVSKGLYSAQTLENITAFMLAELKKEGAAVDAVFYCTHLQEENCACRKPKTGLIENALREASSRGWRIELNESFFVGDSIIDVQTGKAAGLKTVLVFSGREKPLNRDLWQEKPDSIAQDLGEAVNNILLLPAQGSSAIDLESVKIIIAYASAGAGHRKAAEAMFNYIKEHKPEVDVRKIDILAKSWLPFRIAYSYGYVLLIKYFPFIWRLVFELTAAKKKLFPDSFSPLRLITRLATAEFSAYLLEQSPKAVVCTHFLCSEIAAGLARNGRFSGEVFTVITDFGVHPFWVAEGTKTYFAASEDTAGELSAFGIPSEDIRVTGIPVEEGFLTQSLLRGARANDKPAVNKKFTVLIATGSFGIGPFEKIIRMLSPRVRVIVVCAGNKKICQRLLKKNYPEVTVRGLINNMDEVMAEADLIITKPGGLTISESLIMELIPVFIMAIPGQEEENARFIVKNHCGFYLKDLRKLRALVFSLSENPREMESLKGRIRRIKKPGALKDIIDAVCQSSPGLAD